MISDPIVITPDWLIYVLSAVLSLFMSYIPKLRVWYAALETEAKRLFMAGVVLLIAVGVFVLSCYGFFQTNLACTVNGGANLVMIYFLALATNQGVYKVSPQLEDVKQASLRKTNKEEKILLK